MSLQDKLHPVDDTWDTKAQERSAIGDLDARIANNRRATGVAEKMLALKASPGWLPFVKAVEGLREARRKELEQCASTDSYMRVIQGRCIELGSILSLMNDSERNLEGLAVSLEILEKDRSRYVTEDGKIKPHGVHS